MRRNYLKKKIYICILLSFLAGILYVNLMAKDICDTNEIFDTYTLKQYQSMEINTGRYFLYLVRLRLIPIGIVLALMFTRFRKIAVWGTISWTCFLGGFLITAAILCMGIKGSLFCLTAVFPHVLFYLAAYVIVLWYGILYPQTHWELSKTVFITGTMLLGIFLETYLNPVIVKLFVNLL